MSDMGEFDLPEDGEGDGDASQDDDAPAATPAAAPASDIAAAATACMSCGAGIAGDYCIACGQKQDDLRRSLALLGRDFIEDTFAFDSRMWRTLGLLAAAPGKVPTDFSHGRRSRHTPPVRLFLVVSFLFFLTIGVTNTLFMGLHVQFRDADDPIVLAQIAAAEKVGGPVDVDDIKDCSFHAALKFFVKERDLETDMARLTRCIEDRRDKETDAPATASEDGAATASGDASDDISERIFTGIRWTVENPRAFNNAINDWLPRILFLMTPVLALILGLFLRRNVLLFDHMVLSFYVHAVNFSIVAVSLLLTQIGMPLAGLAAGLAVAVYYVLALKRAYGRSWVKTLWTAFASTLIYQLIFLSAVFTIVSRIVLDVAG